MSNDTQQLQAQIRALQTRVHNLENRAMSTEKDIEFKILEVISRCNRETIIEPLEWVQTRVSNLEKVANLLIDGPTGRNLNAAAAASGSGIEPMPEEKDE